MGLNGSSRNPILAGSIGTDTNTHFAGALGMAHSHRGVTCSARVIWWNDVAVSRLGMHLGRVTVLHGPIVSISHPCVP